MGEFPVLELAIRKGAIAYGVFHLEYQFGMYFRRSAVLTRWLAPAILVWWFLTRNHDLLIVLLTVIAAWLTIYVAKWLYVYVRSGKQSDQTAQQIQELIALGPKLEIGSRHLLFLTALSLSDGRGLTGCLKDVVRCPVLAETHFFAGVLRDLDLLDI